MIKMWLWCIATAAVAAFLGQLCYIYAVTKNPFAQDARRKRGPYITDQRKRAEVIKQNFHVEKVQKNLLTTAGVRILDRSHATGSAQD